MIRSFVSVTLNYAQKDVQIFCVTLFNCTKGFQNFCECHSITVYKRMFKSFVTKYAFLKGWRVYIRYNKGHMWTNTITTMDGKSETSTAWFRGSCYPGIYLEGVDRGVGLSPSRPLPPPSHPLVSLLPSGAERASRAQNFPLFPSLPFFLPSPSPSSPPSRPLFSPLPPLSSLLPLTLSAPSTLPPPLPLGEWARQYACRRMSYCLAQAHPNFL